MNLSESYHFRLWTGSLCQDGGNSELLLPAGECGNICVWGILTRHCLLPRAKGLELFEAYLLWPGDAIMHQGAVEFSMFIMISGRSCLAVAELSPIDIA